MLLDRLADHLALANEKLLGVVGVANSALVEALFNAVVSGLSSLLAEGRRLLVFVLQSHDRVD